MERIRPPDRGGSTLAFLDFELDLASGDLRRCGAPVHLFPKTLALLAYLVANRDRAVSKQELLEQVWPDVFVSDMALSSALKDLRRALGDDGSAQRVIQTRRRKGYRFVAAIHPSGPSSPERRASGYFADTVRAGSVHEAPGAWATESQPPAIVGRLRELAWLEARVREAATERPVVALLAGEAGAGKTRLVAELAARPAVAGLEVAIGSCHEPASLPYLPFVEALSAWLVRNEESADTESLHGDDLRTLRRMLEPAGSTFAATTTPPTSSDGKRERIEFFAAVSRTVIRLAQQRPTLLVIEDLHWADAASLDLFVHMVSALSDQAGSTAVPLLVLATYRQPASGDALDGALRRIEREPVCRTLEVGGLDEVGSRQLLAALGAGRVSRRIGAAVHAATQGNPLFIREIARGGLAAADPDEASEVLPLPESLRIAVAARLAELSPACREVLTVAAFIGERFGMLALGAVCGLSTESLVGALAEAARHGLVIGERRSFRFDHPMIRHVLLESVATQQQYAIHGAIADVLEDLYATASGEHTVEIAWHLIHAAETVEPRRLVRFARRAGDQAFAVCAWREAARFYDAALRRAEHLSAEERAALHYRAGLSYNHDLDADACVGHYRLAIEGFEACGDLVGLAWAHMYLLRARFTIASVAPGEKLAVEPVSALVARLGDQHAALRGLLVETMAEAHWTSGDLDRADSLAREALVIGHNLDDDVVCHHACLGLALSRLSRLEVREALEAWREALAYARRSRDPWLQCTPAARIVLALVHLGRLDKARSVARDAVEIGRRAQNASELSFTLAQQACVEVATADFAAAADCIRSAITLMERSSYPWGGLFALTARACMSAWHGDLDGADAALVELVTPGRVFAAPGPAIQLLAGTYREWIAASRQATAPPGSERARNLAKLAELAGRDAFVLGPLCALVEIADLRGAPEVAAQSEEVLHLAFSRGVLFSTGWVFLIPRVLGIAAALRDARSEAAAWFAEAARSARAAGARAELARTLLDEARWRLAWRGPGDAECATRRLAEAITSFDALGLGSAAAHARGIAAAASRPAATPRRMRSSIPPSG